VCVVCVSVCIEVEGGGGGKGKGKKKGVVFLLKVGCVFFVLCFFGGGGGGVPIKLSNHTHCEGDGQEFALCAQILSIVRTLGNCTTGMYTH